MLGRFTVEEINLMCILNTDSRTMLMAQLTEAMPYFAEPELVELSENLLSRLDKMTDADFTELGLFPEYEESEVLP